MVVQYCVKFQFSTITPSKVRWGVQICTPPSELGVFRPPYPAMGLIFGIFTDLIVQNYFPNQKVNSRRYPPTSLELLSKAQVNSRSYPLNSFASREIPIFGTGEEFQCVSDVYCVITSRKSEQQKESSDYCMQHILTVNIVNYQQNINNFHSLGIEVHKRRRKG